MPDTGERIPPALPRPQRMARILARDGGCCVWCSRPLGLGDHALTFEHVVPRLKGGPAWAENEVPACRRCNRERGHTAPSLWLDHARERGLAVRAEVIERALLSLRDAIAERGGQRKARPYLARELRRLGLT
jgi:5-methylcytosine-specific restriction endonuclease McrA